MQHLPVMLDEALDYLAVARGGLFVDGTLGLGGHSTEMLERGATQVIGIDRDPDALAHAAVMLERWGSRVELVHADFRDLGMILDARQISTIDGLLADLGVSSLQLDAEGRGFSFRRDETLDMRMDRSQGRTAADVVAETSETELADIIWRYGEERYSRRVARAIVHARTRTPIQTTAELAAIVRHVVPRGGHRIDAATRTFQALRIRVNGELEGLDRFLRVAVDRLTAGGRLVVISFHSLEDRIVKHTLRALERGADAVIRVLTKRPVRPGDQECARNPRARSARLRAAERLA